MNFYHHHASCARGNASECERAILFIIGTRPLLSARGGVNPREEVAGGQSLEEKRKKDGDL